jgi:hypothetical protein
MNFSKENLDTKEMMLRFTPLWRDPGFNDGSFDQD